MTSAAFVSAIMKDSHPAFRQLYQLWHKRAYYYFLKKSGSDYTARELTQLTFIKIWKYRHTLSPEYTFEAQLFQTAKTIWIDELRRRSREKCQGDMSEVSAQNLTDRSQPDLEYADKDLLQYSIEQLPPMRRKVFILHYVQGFSYKEIARQLLISEKTVDNHISQALRQLRKLPVVALICIISELYY